VDGKELLSDEYLRVPIARDRLDEVKARLGVL